MKDIAQTAIVILNWNGQTLLEKYLPILLQHTLQENVTIYVADNASTDASIQAIEHFPEVKLIRLDANYGFAEGYNRALEGLEHDYFILINSDIEVTPNWYQPLITYMEEHPEVAACQPKIRSLRDRSLFEHAGAAGGFIDRYGYPFCRGRMFHICEKDNGQYDTILPIFWATGACLMIRRKDFTDVGGLDGRFFAHMEEIDLCWRLRARGRGIVCIPQSTVYHLGGATLKQENPYKTFLNFRNNLLMLYKNLPDEELKSTLRIRGWLDALASLSFILKGSWKNALAIWKARKEFHRMKAEMKADREKNLSLMVQPVIPEHIPYSLLKAFYLQGIRRFDQWAEQWKSN